MVALHLPSTQTTPTPYTIHPQCKQKIILPLSWLLKKGNQIPTSLRPPVSPITPACRLGAWDVPHHRSPHPTTSFYRQENLGPEREADLPKVTQQVGGIPQSQETEVLILTARFPPWALVVGLQCESVLGKSCVQCGWRAPELSMPFDLVILLVGINPWGIL